MSPVFFTTHYPALYDGQRDFTAREDLSRLQAFAHGDGS